MYMLLNNVVEMPLCVVKHCKNNSLTQKKDNNVTFHKFPEEFCWKNKWIEVIRRNRKDDSWLPSKYSVVCSVHFEDKDLYINGSGVRDVVKNAVPKKMVAAQIDDDDCIQNENDLRSSSGSQRMVADQIDDDDCIVCDSSSSSGSQSPISHKVIKESTTGVGEDAESNESDSDSSSLLTDNENEPFNPSKVVRIISCPKVEHVNNIEKDTKLDNSLEGRLRRQLKRQTEIVKSNKNMISRLTQKIRRLDARYQIMIKNLNELKEKHDVDQEDLAIDDFLKGIKEKNGKVQQDLITIEIDKEVKNEVKENNGKIQQDLITIEIDEELKEVKNEVKEKEYVDQEGILNIELE